MYQGVVHTSLRLRSRIYNNSLGERLLFRAWNFPRPKQAPSQQTRLWISEVIWFHESESKYTPVPGRGYAPAKIFGEAKLVSVHAPSIHYRENLDSLRPGLGLRSPIVERNKKNRSTCPFTRYHRLKLPHNFMPFLLTNTCLFDQFTLLSIGTGST